MAAQNIDKLLEEWSRLCYALKEYKLEHFPVGSEVFVDAPTYKGKGYLVPTSSEIPLDRVAVCLPNNNIWWYNIRNVKKINYEQI